MSKKKDPFERAKKIRAGELDAEMPSFEELTGWLERVPQTWLPAILSACATQCAVQKVFQPGAMVKKVGVAEARAQQTDWMLRNEKSQTH